MFRYFFALPNHRDRYRLFWIFDLLLARLKRIQNFTPSTLPNCLPTYFSWLHSTLNRRSDCWLPIRTIMSSLRGLTGWDYCPRMIGSYPNPSLLPSLTETIPHAPLSLRLSLGRAEEWESILTQERSEPCQSHENTTLDLRDWRAYLETVAPGNDSSFPLLSRPLWPVWNSISILLRQLLLIPSNTATDSWDTVRNR